MTVIFGFAARKRRISFLGSDNLEYRTQRHVDKIIKARHFLVGCYGADAPFEAASVVAYLEPEEHETSGVSFGPGEVGYAAKTPSQFCERVAETLPTVAKHLWNNALSNDWGPQELEMAKSSTGNLVLLDCREHALYSAHCGEIFPPKERYWFTLNSHADDAVFRFGINDVKEVCPVSERMLRDPIAWCASEICEARTEVEGHGWNNAIGERGACVLVRGSNGKNRQRWTSFTSHADAADHFFRRRSPKTG